METSKPTRIEPWFAELYKLAIDGKLSINELYTEFKKSISRTQNDYGEGLTAYFYSSDWPWGKERDGCYYISEEVVRLESQNKKLIEALEFYANKNNWEAIPGHTRFMSSLKIEDCAFYNCGGGRARLVLEDIKK